MESTGSHIVVAATVLGVSDSGRVDICYRFARIAYVGAASLRPTDMREVSRASRMECDIYIYTYIHIYIHY